MKKIKSIISMLLVLSILTAAGGCTEKKTDGSSSSASSSSISSDSSTGSSSDSGTSSENDFYSSDTSSSYDEVVDSWKEEEADNNIVTDGEFNQGENQGSNTDNTLTPGYDGVYDTEQEPVEDLSNNNQEQGEEETPKEEAKYDGQKHETLIPSNLTDSENLDYYYEGTDYAYGITVNGAEFIAYKTEDGRLFDIIEGGGKYSLSTTAGVSALSVDNVVRFTPSMSDSYTSLEVEYSLSGLIAGEATIVTTYIFKEASISMTSVLNAKTSSRLSHSKSSLHRKFSNGKISSLARVDDRWVYPNNGDYPYPDFDSLVFKDQIDDTLFLYTTMRGEELPSSHNRVNEMDGSNLPLYFTDGGGVMYTFNCDIAFVDTEIDGTNEDYIGRFKTGSNDFALGITPLQKVDDSSSVYMGDRLDLNINVTNLTQDDLKFSLRYDVRDYYGKVVSKGIFIDSTVYKFSNVNRVITLKDKYGMFYLNIYAISRYSTYHECYPFGILREHTYKYNATSPFGLSTSALANGVESARLTAKLGFANYRIVNVNSGTDELVKLGITQFNGHFNPTNNKSEAVGNYVDRVVAATESMIDIIDSMEVGNEMSLAASRPGGPPLEKLYPQFYNYTFIPTYNALREKFPNLLYIPTPFSACEQEWIKMFSEGFIDGDGDGLADKDKNGNLIRNLATGSWSFVDSVATHIYGNPWMPDAYGAVGEPSYGVGMWHIEQGMQRMKQMMDDHRSLRNGKEDPLFYLTEIGYPTPPGEAKSVCLRTQADYTVRLGLICVGYGVDRLQYFRLTDRMSTITGYDPAEPEMNFGMMYQTDYYGILKPKPAVIAYAAMAQQLESIEKDGASIDAKYDEGWKKDGVRAFKVKTKEHGNVLVAWSNKEILTNGKKNSTGSTGDRTPCLPWNNQWQKTDKTVFDAVGSQVTVRDLMGNETVCPAKGGKVEIELTGSPVYIYGVK